ncbi:MAG TPA: hypothetical protein VIS99_07130 [Terrimicrobiaceae bacterium]
MIASFRIVESMGFKGEFRQWEDLLRIEIPSILRRGQRAEMGHRYSPQQRGDRRNGPLCEIPVDLVGPDL